MLLDRLRSATMPAGPKRLHDRIPSNARLRRDARRDQRRVSGGVARFLWSGTGDVNRRSDNHRENLYRYSVCRRQDLLERIIPFFRECPLRTAKRFDFEKFASCVERMADDRHLTREGLVEIVRIAETMNRRKPRHELIRILRDHTPDALDRG